MTDERFSVWQFLDDGAEGTIQEKVRHLVPLEEAVLAFKHYIDNVAANVLKITQRVIIVDGGDCVNMEWKRDEGIVFPPELKGRMKL